MTRLAKYLAAAATAGLFAVPAAAQYSPQPYQQPYAQPYQQPYAQPYQQPYAQPYSPNQYGYPNQGTNVIGQVIDQLLGNRYNVTDRQAIRQCASAAVAQASAQYGGNRGYNQGYNGQPYGNGYNQGYSGYAHRAGDRDHRRPAPFERASRDRHARFARRLRSLRQPWLCQPGLWQPC